MKKTEEYQDYIKFIESEIKDEKAICNSKTKILIHILALGTLAIIVSSVPYFLKGEFNPLNCLSISLSTTCMFTHLLRYVEDVPNRRRRIRHLESKLESLNRREK